MPAPLDILLVEDNPDHAELAKLILEATGIDHMLHHLTDGDEALRYLRHETPFNQAPMPDLLLLDLFLPNIDGIQIAQKIHQDKNLSKLHVVLLTSADLRDHEADFSTLPKTVERMSKPLKLEEISRLLNDLRSRT